MSKYGYKVGDYVKRMYPWNRTGAWDKGQFKVIAIDESLNEVTLAENPKAYISFDRVWDADKFKLAISASEPTGETYILVLKEGKAFKPATTPHVYNSEAAARTVAAVMAERHLGKEFVIFKAVGKAKTNTATVEMF